MKRRKLLLFLSLCANVFIKNRKGTDGMKKAICSFMVLVLIVSMGGMQPAQAEVKEDYKLYVMAPLTEISDWDAFEANLKTMKKNGVYALTTDIWWGMVERKGDNQFDWSYYEKYAEAVEESGLKWV